MKIVDITEFYSERGGGVRTYLTMKGQVLRELGHEHVVIAPGPRDDESLLPAAVTTARGGSENGGGSASVVRIAGPALPYDPSYFLLGNLPRVIRRLRHEAPDVVEVHSPYLATLGALWAGRSVARARTFFWHADFLDTYLRVALEKQRWVLGVDRLLATLWSAVKSGSGLFDATLVGGKQQAAKLTGKGFARVVHVPLGVDTDVFSPARRTAARRHALLGGERPGAKLVVSVGRFAVEKRWDIVIDAFRQVRRTVDARLVFFGDGPERALLEARARGCADIVFLGFEPRKVALAEGLAGADLLVHACPYETFGLGVAEALACGVPALVPDQGGAREYVSADNGAIYRSLDVAACARAMEQMLTRPTVVGAKTTRVPGVRDHVIQVLREYEKILACSSARS